MTDKNENQWVAELARDLILETASLYSNLPIDLWRNT